MTAKNALFVTDAQLAERMGLPTVKLQELLPTITKAGFPEPDPLFENRRYWPACLSEKQAVEVKIKPLEWDSFGRAHSEVGTYEVVCIAQGGVFGLWRPIDDGSTFPNDEGSEEHCRAAAQADYEQRIRSALVDVPAVEPVNDDLIGYVMRYGGMCRDCADMDGVCQSGQPCDTDQRGAVIKHTIAALAYGIKHGFIANPFQSSLREGEDSEEVLRSALQRISELTPARANARDARDLRLTVKAIAEVALAATRSASATTATGGDHG